MLRKQVTYENFDGETVTETLYFNLSKAEILELNSKYDGGVRGEIERAQDTGDNFAVYNFVKNFVLACYGEKSADGKRFVKSDEIRDAFQQSQAFDEFLFGMLEADDNGAQVANFVRAVMPPKLVELMEKEQARKGVTS